MRVIHCGRLRDDARAEIENEYSGLQRRLLDSSWKLLRQYGLQDDYRITQDGLVKFSEAIKESDPSKRHRMQKYLEGEFSVYAPYWFYRAESLRLSGDNGGAEEYFAKFAEVWRPVLRKDPYMAEYMKFKIEGLMRGGINPNNAGEIMKCLEVMRANSPIDEWANNIYMGMVYFALGYKDKAEECVMCNIDFRFETETSGRLLGYFDIFMNVISSKLFCKLLVVASFAFTAYAHSFMGFWGLIFLLLSCAAGNLLLFKIIASIRNAGRTRERKYPPVSLRSTSPLI